MRQRVSESESVSHMYLCTDLDFPTCKFTSLELITHVRLDSQIAE